jgi:hypothetical protein
MSRKEKFFRFTERFGHMMSRVLLTVLYVTLVAPAGILLSLFSDKLGIRRFRGTSWNDWKRTNETPSQARRQD